MSTSSFWLNLSKPGDGDTAWGTEIRNFMETVDRLVNPGKFRIVGSQYSTANLFPYGAPSNRLLHDTIQGAIDAVEANSSDDATNTILVFPGDYGEDLTIRESVNIVGVNPLHSQVMGTTRINGTGSNPPVTFTPNAGLSAQCNFANIRFGQNASSFGGGTVAWPYWARANDQGASNYGTFHNRLHFHNCFFRLDAFSGSDVFTYGFWCEGKIHVLFTDCQMRLPVNADMTKPITVEGNNATGEQASLFMKRTDVWQPGSAGQTIHIDDNCQGQIARCSFTRTRSQTLSVGGTGTNALEGMNDDGEVTAHGNLMGVNHTFPY